MDKSFRFRERDGYLFLTSYIGEDEILKIPTTYKGRPITGITRKFISNCERNYSYKLKEVIIPDTVKIIERKAFYGCHNIEKITFSKDLKFIGQNAFSGCNSLNEIILHENVSKIELNAFRYCDKITKFICSNKDISVSKSALDTLTNIEEVSLNIVGFLPSKKQVFVIENTILDFNRFKVEEQKEIITFINQKINLKKSLFISNKSEIIAFLIDKKIKISLTLINDFIDYHVNENNTKIVAMLLELKNKNYNKKDIDENIERKEMIEIGLELPTFSELRKDWKFSKRNSVIKITGYKGISKVQTIPVSLNDGTLITEIQPDDYKSYDVLEILRIEAQITEIGRGLFYKNVNLREIVLPESVTDIGYYAFCNCVSLTSINIPEKVTSIGSYAFKSCTAITSIIIPNEVKYIGGNAFNDCKQLNVVTLSKNLINIGDYAFNNCVNLKEIILPENLSSIGKSGFAYCEILEEMVIPISVKNLGEEAFTNCFNLKKVEIKGEIKKIEDCTFEDCKSLKEVILPDTLEEICFFAFKNCMNLEEITIPASVKNISSSAFYGCNSLKKVNFLGKYFDIGV